MKILETEKRSCHQRHDSCHPGAKIKDNTESQRLSDLSEQQEALMVEVTIPNCYKQAIRSRDASKWHDAMDKEINVMMERKVWDLVDHPDNKKILENCWVYTIKSDENNKIVRYKARLVARGNTQLRGESFDEVFSPVINFTIVRLFFTICVCLWKWTHIQVDITNDYLYANLDTVIYMKQPTGYEIDNNKVYSDFATNRDDRVSMGGFITFIDKTPISWRTFKQSPLVCRPWKLKLFFMNSVASTLNRVTDMEFNNKISVLTQNNWNTWKHDMQALLMHYGCWQFIIQTKPDEPDEEATYKKKLDLQLREDVGIFISRVKTAATRLQEAGHKLNDMYIGFQLIRWLPQEFQSTVQQINRWKEEYFRVVKIEAELILEANRLQLTKQDLEKAENAYLSSFISKKSKTLPGATDQLMEIQMARMITKRKVPDHYIIPKSKEISSFSDVTAKTKNGSIEMWHQRFCHVNNDYLVKTSKNDSVKGLPRLTDNGKTHCIPCKLAKSKRVSFKKTGAVRSKRPLELLHMDLCSPMPTESQGGNKYFLSIIDDYSRKVTVFPIRNISDVFHTFIRFQKRAERFLSKKVIAVRTNCGLEFCNKDMDNFLTELGIKHEVTNSYTQEMNGVAERFNLTALDGIKTLLKSSEVPHKFWGAALLCFTYAWNRICHKDSNKTPFEKYSGRKPTVLHLIPFGCLSYAGVPKQIRKKFDMRAKMGIMMGYAQPTKDNTESQRLSDLSEQQEALMVEVTIPNCYKQAIRSRDASKWHDAMDKEINVMMERKVWDLVDHPDNIKILENRWVYTIKYDENNKIVRYKARLVARALISNYWSTAPTAKFEASVQSNRGSPDLGKDRRAALAMSVMHFLKVLLESSVQCTFLQSFFFALFNSSCRGA
ncbi:retrovirus-related Pol polyprotein from transposon TNT 1-94 [Trichonephila clavipes]|nr:retrovirus-related Pol polyprotein from transposon TNT 1-94 [Trichonephila clavipes]